MSRTQVGKTNTLVIDANNSIAFNGSTQLGTVLNYTALNGLTDWTLEYWVYNAGANSAKTILRLDDNPASGNYFFNDGFDGSGANTANSVQYYSSNTAFAGTTSATRASNTWEHNAWVMPAATTKTLVFYINGVLKSLNFVQTGSGTQGTSNSMNLYVGNNGNAGSYSTLRIANLRLWNVNRTAAQLLAYKNYYLDPSQETGLIMNLNFNEGSGTSVSNTVSGGNNMTLTNTPTWSAGPLVTAYVYNGPRTAVSSPARSVAGTRTLNT